MATITLTYDDEKNRLSGYQVSVGNATTSYAYSYGESYAHPDAVTGLTVNGTRILDYEYDSLGRLKVRTLATDTPFETEYTYLAGAAEGTTTTLVSSMKNGNDTLSYTYDALGNVTSIRENGVLLESYTYDALNQLKTVTRGNDVWEYTYDNGGNLLSVKKNGVTEKTYSYGNAEWRDLLTSFNGESITYDAIGNPLTYRGGMAFTWVNGRRLSTITQNGATFAYTYGADGLRTSKTVGGVTTTFLWLNGTLRAQTTGTETLTFLYDAAGSLYGFTLGGSTYYYVFNLQGDVIAILDDAGDEVVKYTYDAWGKLLSTTGSLASTIGAKNPFRYRSYYYDAETGFYYLQSRYYDPEIGRFINADGLVAGLTGSLHGYNQFAYCFNNPVNMLDTTGNWPQFIKDAAKWVDDNIIQPVVDYFEGVAQDFENYDKNNTSEKVVSEATLFSSYKGKLVIIPPISLGPFSYFNTIFLTSDTKNDEELLKHEYGHTVQWERDGMINYTINVAFPSFAINFSDSVFGWLPYDYYSYPWEAEANELGGSKAKDSANRPAYGMGKYDLYNMVEKKHYLR